MFDMQPIQEAEAFARRADALTLLAAEARGQIATANARMQLLSDERTRLDEQLAQMRRAAEEINARQKAQDNYKALLDGREAAQNARDGELDAREDAIAGREIALDRRQIDLDMRENDPLTYRDKMADRANGG